MADTKISADPTAGAFDGTEIIPVVQAGANKKSALSVLKTWVLSARLAHVIMTIQDAGNLTWTSMGAALDDFRGNSSNARWNTDLTGFSDVQIACNVITAGASGAELRAQYSTNSGSTWNYFGTNTPAVVIDTTGQKASTWVAVPAAAQGVCWVRVVGINGNGSTSPVFGWVCLRGR